MRAALPRDGRPLLVLLDFDGTLVPIAPTPDAIEVPDALPATLGALRDAGHAVFVVTGRPADFVTERVPDTPVIGLHGLQWPGEPVPPRASALDDALTQARALSARFPGLLVEDKGVSLALHVRQVPADHHDEAATACRALVGDTLARAPSLTLIEGHEVFEIRPRDASKARAVRRLVAAHPGRQVVYVGDDVTDEEAFEALPSDALAVRVGPEGVRTRAAHRLPDVASVYALLAGLSRTPTGRSAG